MGAPRLFPAVVVATLAVMIACGGLATTGNGGSSGGGGNPRSGGTSGAGGGLGSSGSSGGSDSGSPTIDASPDVSTVPNVTTPQGCGSSVCASSQLCLHETTFAPDGGSIDGGSSCINIPANCESRPTCACMEMAAAAVGCTGTECSLSDAGLAISCSTLP